MARSFLINISGTGPSGAVSIYLTSDGLIGGRRCRTEIPEADHLLTPHSGNTTVGNSGSPFTEKPLIAGKGRPFNIRIASGLQTARYDALKELIDFVADAGTELVLTATGEPGDINVDWIPRFEPVPIGFEKFSDGWIKGVTIRGITSGVN